MLLSANKYFSLSSKLTFLVVAVVAELLSLLLAFLV